MVGFLARGATHITLRNIGFDVSKQYICIGELQLTIDI
jgi:hypothetical protein